MGDARLGQVIDELPPKDFMRHILPCSGGQRVREELQQESWDLPKKRLRELDLAVAHASPGAIGEPGRTTTARALVAFERP